MSERQYDTMRFKQELDEHITRSDEAAMSNPKDWAVEVHRALRKAINECPTLISDDEAADAIRTALAGYAVVTKEWLAEHLVALVAEDGDECFECLNCGEVSEVIDKRVDAPHKPDCPLAQPSPQGEGKHGDD